MLDEGDFLRQPLVGLIYPHPFSNNNIVVRRENVALAVSPSKYSDQKINIHSQMRI